MNDSDFQRELLLTRIDAHRGMFRLELRAARAEFDPVAIGLGWLGVDRKLVRDVMPALRALHRDGMPSDLKHAGPLLALVAAALVAWSD
jgi:hypothetical protein